MAEAVSGLKPHSPRSRPAAVVGVHNSTATGGLTLLSPCILSIISFCFLMMPRLSSAYACAPRPESRTTPTSQDECIASGRVCASQCKPRIGRGQRRRPGCALAATGSGLRTFFMASMCLYWRCSSSNSERMRLRSSWSDDAAAAAAMAGPARFSRCEPVPFSRSPAEPSGQLLAGRAQGNHACALPAAHAPS